MLPTCYLLTKIFFYFSSFAFVNGCGFVVCTCIFTIPAWFFKFIFALCIYIFLILGFGDMCIFRYRPRPPKTFPILSPAWLPHQHAKCGAERDYIFELGWTIHSDAHFNIVYCFSPTYVCLLCSNDCSNWNNCNICDIRSLY